MARKILFISLFLLLICAQHASATLCEVSDENLDQVYGAAGVSIAVKNMQIHHWIDSFRYLDTTNGGLGYVAFNNIDINDSNGGPYTLNYDFGSVSASGIIEFDVGSTLVAEQMLDWSTTADPSQVEKITTATKCDFWDQDITYHINNFKFAAPSTGEIDLGRLDLGPVDLQSYRYFAAPHTSGGGIDFEYDFKLHIGELYYGYQCNSGIVSKSLQINDMYFGKTFGFGTGSDDPADPTTWTSDYGEFQIGDMFGDITQNTYSNPGLIDVGGIAVESSIYSVLAMNFPIQGSIRFEQVEFGGIDFGPGAIDGINAHRLRVFLIP